MEKDCPVDFIQVNENKVRLNALWVFILVGCSLFCAAFPIYIFLAIDFFLRAFNFGKFSALNWLSQYTIGLFNIPNKPIDQAPKRFAAGIGFVLSIIIIVLLLLQLYKIAAALKIIFITFAFLESFVGFCAGCYVYTFLKKINLIK